MSARMPLLPRFLAPLLGLALLAPLAAGAEMYAWRTDDGVFAYADDRDKVPARYAERAVRVGSPKLSSYPRLTEEDTAASRAVSDRMAERLEYLRRLNAPAPSPATAAAPTTGRATVSVATGNAQAPSLDIEAGPGDPIVVEPILAKGAGESRTRRVTLVKQGDRTLAVIKGRSHHYDVNRDIHDEEDLTAR